MEATEPLANTANKGQLPKEVGKPHVSWSGPDTVDGWVTVSLFAPYAKSLGMNHFLCTMVSEWLIPGLQLPVQYYQNTEETDGLVSEIAVKVDPDQFEAVREALPELAKEVAFGALSTPHANHILETKGLSRDKKAAQIYQKILRLIQRRRSPANLSLLSSVTRFHTVAGNEFLKIRELPHLTRLICTHHTLLHQVHEAVKIAPAKRHIRMKLLRTHLHFPFGSKKVVGVSVCLNFLRDYESFIERHMMRSIKEVIPTANAVPDSYFQSTQGSPPVRFTYVEIEKEEGFSCKEIRLMQEKLPPLFKDGVETLSPYLFANRNDEELYHHMVVLAGELRQVNDLAQAMIFFLSHEKGVLRFQVVGVRVMTEDSLAAAEIASRPVEGVRITLEQISPVGSLKKRHAKEGAVFTVELDATPFIRRDHAIDLVKARARVVDALKEIGGDFRDFNGGLFEAQNRQLLQLKDLLSNREWDEHLIETIFYRITPAAAQGYICPYTLKELCELLCKPSEEALKQTGYVLDFKQLDGSLALTLRANSPSLCDEVVRGVEALRLEPHEIACVRVTIDDTQSLGYLYQTSSVPDQNRLIAAVQQVIEGWLEAHHQTQVARINLPLGMTFLDPRVAADRISGIVIKMLYEGLMRRNQEGQPVPAISEKVEISEDQKTYTFHLRETFWSDGNPVTAHDFEYAWKKAIDPKLHPFYSFLFSPIKNAGLIRKGAVSVNEVGLQVIDDRTLKVELEFPTPYFLELTTLWVYSPLPRELDAKRPGWAYFGGNDYICNGPFKPVLWKPNEALHLAKNPRYWGAENVRLSRLEIAIFEDPDRALKLFQQGQLDWIGDPLWELPLSSLPKLREAGKLQTKPMAGIFSVQLNTDRFPFHSKKVRQAFAYGLDRQALIDDVLGGDEEPALSLIPDSVSSAKPYFADGDKERALSLFGEALMELGIPPHQFPPLTLTHSDHPEHVALTHAIGNQWSELFGITIRYESLSWGELVNQLRNHRHLMATGTFYSWYRSSTYLLYRLGSSEPSINYTGWQDPQFQSLFEKGRSQTDIDRREEYFKQAEEVAMEEMPLIPIYHYHSRYLIQDHLKGVHFLETGQIDFTQAHVQANETP